MEAAAAQAGLPRFRFDPDDDLIRRYLFPRLQGGRTRNPPFGAAIIDDEPLSAPPWELLRKHGRKEDEAFFIASGHALGRRDNRKKRSCVGGGYWQGQKVSVDNKNLLVGGTGTEIRWRKYILNYHADAQSGSMGWVMHEYSVTAPPDLASSPVRLYRVRFSGHGKKRQREPQDPGGDHHRARAKRPGMFTSCVMVDAEATSLNQCCSTAAVSDRMMNTNEMLDCYDQFLHEEVLASGDNVVLPTMPAGEGSGVAAITSTGQAGTSSWDHGLSASAAVMDDQVLDNIMPPDDIDEVLRYFYQNPHELWADGDAILPELEDSAPVPPPESTGDDAAVAVAVAVTTSAEPAPVAGTSTSDGVAVDFSLDDVVLPENMDELMQLFSFDDFSSICSASPPTIDPPDVTAVRVGGGGHG